MFIYLSFSCSLIKFLAYNYLLKFSGILAMQVIFVNGKSADKGTLLLGISNRQLITSYK